MLARRRTGGGSSLPLDSSQNSGLNLILDKRDNFIGAMALSSKYLSPTCAPDLRDIATSSFFDFFPIRYRNVYCNGIILNAITPKNGAIAKHAYSGIGPKYCFRYILAQAHILAKGICQTAAKCHPPPGRGTRTFFCRRNFGGTFVMTLDWLGTHIELATRHQSRPDQHRDGLDCGAPGGL